MKRVIRLEKVNGLVGGVVFGPVVSRRFGRSLGINPLPPDRKICTFDCPYCECGPTLRGESRRLDEQPFPPAGDVIEAVRGALSELARHRAAIDNLTLTGNGETTLHPEFERIVAAILGLRDRYLPGVQVVVLTNGTRLNDASVRQALGSVDQCVVKLDAGREETFRRINRPLEPVTLDEITAAASRLPRLVIQTMFVRGRVDNTGEDEIEAWIARLKKVEPRAVQIYSIDRAPAERDVIAVARAELEQIAAHVIERTGLPVAVYS